MKTLLLLACRSLKSRKLSTLLTVFSVSLSVFLILGVERLRRGTEESFSNTLSQTDLIVGARSSELQLLLYSVFHMGDATNNISMESFRVFRDHPATEWTIPISLGDSHRGYRVVATDQNFYEHYRYQEDQSLVLAQGKAAEGVFDVVLGAEVAKKLNYHLGSNVVLSHGISAMSLTDHADKPFRVVGVLKSTGTPVDRALYITLEGMEAIHIDWQNGAMSLSGVRTADAVQKDKIEIRQITSFLLRTKNRIATVRLQREINVFDAEPLMAVIPGVALSKLWESLSMVDMALRAVSACVAFVSLLGLLLLLLSSLNERRREMAVLRSLGLRPLALFFLLSLESFLIVLVGIFFGVGAVYAFLLGSKQWMLDEFGLFVPVQALSASEWIFLMVLLCASMIVGFFPSITAYRKSVSDGLSVRF